MPSDSLMQLTPLEFASRIKIIFGPGIVQRVGALAHELNLKNVLLVTDAGIVQAGHAGRITKLLQAADVSVACYDRVRENPTTQDVTDCVAVAQAHSIDGLIGLGGGSAMDTAKGCNFILTNGGRMQDYWGIGKAPQAMLPFIAIPTTAGTGSEMQSAALIADEVTHQKMACLDAKCAARFAILDPDLTLSQPPRVTACTGIDAIAHAVETAVTTKRNETSQHLSREAFQLLHRAFPKVLVSPNDRNARAEMQLGAAYAGAAIEHSMLGAAHAAANPLTAHFGVVHGHAVGLMLPHVVRWNAAHTTARAGYEAMLNGGSVEKLPDQLAALLKQTGLSTSLHAAGVTRESLTELAAEAARQWTATFNPRPIVAADFLELYEAAFA